MSKPPDGQADADRARLRRIADLVGVPMETLFAEAGADQPVGELARILRLCSDLEPAGRRAVLAFAAAEHRRGRASREPRRAAGKGR